MQTKVVLCGWGAPASCSPLRPPHASQPTFLFCPPPPTYLSVCAFWLLEQYHSLTFLGNIWCKILSRIICFLTSKWPVIPEWALERVFFWQDLAPVRKRNWGIERWTTCSRTPTEVATEGCGLQVPWFLADSHFSMMWLLQREPERTDTSLFLQKYCSFKYARSGIGISATRIQTSLSMENSGKYPPFLCSRKSQPHYLRPTQRWKTFPSLEVSAGISGWQVLFRNETKA